MLLQRKVTPTTSLHLCSASTRLVLTNCSTREVVHAVKVNVRITAGDPWWTWIPNLSMTNLMRWIAEVCCAFLVRLSDELLKESHDEWLPQNVCCADCRDRSCH